MIKGENSENVPHLEIIWIVLVHCNVLNNDYQHDSRVLHTFFPNALFGHLINISPKTLILTFIYGSMIYWSNTEPPEMEDNININLVIN